jgi:glycosyltransferase involved in cell wall biosynthesis
VSVVIPTHQRRAQLDAVLEEILANTAPAEVVVVDDGSTDGTDAMLRRRAEAEPRLRAVVQENGGSMSARLTGARAATGDVVLLLDDDVVPEAGTVEGHARHHAVDERVVVAGYMPVAPAARDGHSYPRDIYSRTYEGHCRAWEAEPDRMLQTLWSGHISVRRDALLALEPRLRGVSVRYHEDLDFGLLCAEAGLRGIFDRTLRSRHVYERSPAGWRRDAANSGRGLADVHARHVATLGPFDPAGVEAGLPAPAAWLLRRSRTSAWPRRVLRAAINVLGAVRALRLQRFAAGLLWRIDQREAAIGRTTELQSASQTS